MRLVAPPKPFLWTSTDIPRQSSFRDWAGEETSFPSEVAEAALAHSVGNAVERAHRRGDALEKRRRLMDAWAEFVEGTKTDNVRALNAG